MIDEELLRQVPDPGTTLRTSVPKGQWPFPERARRGIADAILFAVTLFAVFLVLPGPVCAHPALHDQIAHLTAGIELHPDEALLYLRRGDLHRYRGEWALARADYRHARRLTPGLEIVDLHVGALYLAEGKPRRARAALDRYLTRRPEDPEGLRLRARALRARGRQLAAAEDLGRVIAAMSPSRRAEPDDYLEWARAFEAAGPDYLDEAIRALDQGVSALGSIVSLQVPAIELEVHAGRLAEALRRVDDLAGASTGGAGTGGAGRREVWLAKRAEILERAGREIEAREAYQETLRTIAALPRTERSRAIGMLEADVRAALERVSSRPDDLQRDPGSPGER